MIHSGLAMADVLTITQPCALDLECPEGVVPPADSSLELARYLFSVRGKSVLDLGCGTGILGIVASKLGAREVTATDISPAAVECTRGNAQRNHAPVSVRAGDLFDPVRGQKFDLIVTHPPQMPAPPGVRGPGFAGPDGLLYFDPILLQALKYLEEGGQLLTLLGSLADTKRFEGLLSESFRFRALPKSRRELAREELDRLHPALFDHLLERRKKGLAEVEEESGKLSYWIRFYMAIRR
jgi:release factor glutamine methyltransferase